MKKLLMQYAVCALAVVLTVSLAYAQPAGLQAAWASDAGTLSDKFTALAQVMAGKYEWKPGQGVRSVGDVFNLIVRENGLLADALTGKTNSPAKPAPITDPEKMQDALKASFRQRPADTGETVRRRHDQAGRGDADSRRSTRAFGAVDRVRAHQRRGSALV
jgi:hypothetical protein